jgi:transposase-like protein
MGDHSKILIMPSGDGAGNGTPADPPAAAVDSGGGGGGGKDDSGVESGGGGGNGGSGGGDRNLTPQQRQAALLRAKGWRWTRIAKELDVDESTLFRWNRLRAFATALEAAEQDIKADMMAAARGSCGLAMETLDNVMANGTPAASLAAAVVVLRMNGLYKPK